MREWTLVINQAQQVRMAGLTEEARRKRERAFHSPDRKAPTGDSTPWKLRHDPVMKVCLIVEPVLIPRFYQILQAGFFLGARVGLSIGAFLREFLGLSDRYIGERINTVFLNSEPVDDLEAALIKENSILALSSAMPGLVGATLRRKSLFASFRSAITHDDKENAPVVSDGVIRVKLFNIVMSELGPELLKGGIYLPPSNFAEFLRSEGAGFFDGVKTAYVDGRDVDPMALGELILNTEARWVEIRACESLRQ